jgi:hypothetical protein
VRYDIRQYVPGLRGQNLMEQGADGKPTQATYASLLLLLAGVQEQAPMKARELYKILDAVDAANMHGCTDCDEPGAPMCDEAMLELTAVQVAFVQDVASKVLTPLAYGRLVDFLESPQASVPEKAGGTA